MNARTGCRGIWSEHFLGFSRVRAASLRPSPAPPRLLSHMRKTEAVGSVRDLVTVAVQCDSAVDEHGLPQPGECGSEQPAHMHLRHVQINRADD